MSEILTLAGFKNIKWVPHCVSNTDLKNTQLTSLKVNFYTRNNKAIYVGGFIQIKTIDLFI